MMQINRISYHQLFIQSVYFLFSSTHKKKNVKETEEKRKNVYCILDNKNVVTSAIRFTQIPFQISGLNRHRITEHQPPNEFVAHKTADVTSMATTPETIWPTRTHPDFFGFRPDKNCD